MSARRMLLLFATIFAIGYGFADTRAVAATPSFTFTASNATMSTDGSGSVSWTLTSVDGYAGTFSINCTATSTPVGAKLPVCGESAVAQAYTLTANGTVQGTIGLSATFCSTSNPSACPVKLDRKRPGFGAGFALAGALLLGLGFRRRRVRSFTFMLLAAGMLAGIVGITSCSGGSNTLTPGVWPYTVTATDLSTGDYTSTSITVTVPAGVSVSYY